MSIPPLQPREGGNPHQVHGKLELRSCPGSPNFMWVQGLYGPRSPSVTMGAAFGGLFLSKNVLTIRCSAASGLFLARLPGLESCFGFEPF